MTRAFSTGQAEQIGHVYMGISYFHQAQLNNWQMYHDLLEDRRWSVAWDEVVLTAANERQAEAYSAQLELRRRLGMLPAKTCFHVVADPAGRRVGSGGATLNVLLRLSETRERPADFFTNRRILILHSGGDSKRLPQYSAFGKIFAPIPRLLKSGRPSTLFDELFTALVGVPARMNPGVVTASGDVLLLFDHTQLELTRPGFTGVAIPTDLQTAQHHGVYVTAEHAAVRNFLHKPNEAEMLAGGAIREDGQAAVDTGIVYFTADAASLLVGNACGPNGWLQRLMNAGAPLNFYGDFLMPLAPATVEAEFLDNRTDGAVTAALQMLRADIWRALRGLPFFVETLSPAKFLHFGTVAEYQRLVTFDDEDIQALGGRRRISHDLADTVSVDEHVCILHSSIDTGVIVESGCVVEYSRIGAHGCLQAGSVVSHSHVPDHVRIPARTVVQTLPLQGEHGVAWVVRVWGVHDNPKAALPEATLCGRPLEVWLREHGLTVAQVWPDQSDPAAWTLWNARLYVRAETEADAWRAADWLLQQHTETVPASPEWIAARRESLASSYETADLQEIGERQNALFADLVFRKCRHFFQQQYPVQNWFEKIPTEYDFKILVQRLSATATELQNPLERIRWLYSIAELVRRHGGATSQLRSEVYENQAFAELADSMQSLRQRHEPQCVSWRRQKAEVVLPVRVDFAGGWSDTPPHTLERGGIVLNGAVRLESQLPVKVFIERLEEPRCLFESRDLGVSGTMESMAELMAYQNPRDPLAVHKAAFCLVSGCEQYAGRDIAPFLRQMGGGIAVISDVRVPKGSGLGTSSILAAALVKALLLMTKAAEKTAELVQLLRGASMVEQMLTTGGGWQDQVGGLCPGLKLTRGRPGFEHELIIEPLELLVEQRQMLDAQLVIIDTGQRRLARNLLREVMGRWLARDAVVVNVLIEIQDIALQMKEVLRQSDLATAGQLLWRHWELNKQLDAQTSNPFIEQLIDSLRPYLLGAKLAGAGGGGFLLGLCKPGQRSCIAEHIKAEFASSRVKLYDAAFWWD